LINECAFYACPKLTTAYICNDNCVINEIAFDSTTDILFPTNEISVTIRSYDAYRNARTNLNDFEEPQEERIYELIISTGILSEGTLFFSNILYPESNFYVHDGRLIYQFSSYDNRQTITIPKGSIRYTINNKTYCNNEIISTT
jgi:hypothetical protein